MGRLVTLDRLVRGAIPDLKETRVSLEIQVLQGRLVHLDHLVLVVNRVREGMLVQLDRREQMEHQDHLEMLGRQELEGTLVYQEPLEQSVQSVPQDPEGGQARKAQPGLGEARDQQAIRAFRAPQAHKDSEATAVSPVPPDLPARMVREERPDLEEIQDSQEI